MGHPLSSALGINQGSNLSSTPTATSLAPASTPRGDDCGNPLHTSQHLHPHPSILLSSGASGSLWKLKPESITPPLRTRTTTPHVTQNKSQVTSPATPPMTLTSTPSISATQDSEVPWTCQACAHAGALRGRSHSLEHPQPLPPPPAAMGSPPCLLPRHVLQSQPLKSPGLTSQSMWETPPALPRQLQSPSPSSLSHHTDHSLT